LVEISERLQALPSIRSMLSRSFIEKSLFTWISNRYIQKDTPNLFIEYLENEANEVVKTTTSWVPIANLETEVPFPISNSEVRPISKIMIEKWEANCASSPNSSRADVKTFFDDIRKKYQGLAAVVTSITAEPQYAYEYAIEEAKLVSSILGIFSGATLIPDVKCVSKIKGSELIEQATAIFDGGESDISLSSSMIDLSSAKSWRLSQRDIVEIRKCGLDTLSSLLSQNALNGFKKSVLNAALLYSKSAFTSDPVEKVVYILSSMESILLKNENEPIQQNLAERLAVFTAHKLKERKRIIKTVRSAYGVRSRYLHHGHTSSELKLIEDFMMCAWIFFIQLLENTERFDSQEEFVGAIDDHKLG